MARFEYREFEVNRPNLIEFFNEIGRDGWEVVMSGQDTVPAAEGTFRLVTRVIAKRERET